MSESLFACSGLEGLLLDCGWSWGHEQLRRVTKWLALQGIKQRRDLVELRLDDLDNIEKWPNEARAQGLMYYYACYASFLYLAGTRVPG